MDFECYDNMTVEELMVERDKLLKEINNENSWALIRRRTTVELNMHASNVENLQQRVEYVTDLIKERLVNINETLG